MSNDGTATRHVLVTGSSSGIGRAIAETLCAGGVWRVSGLDRDAAPWAHPAFTAHAVDLCDATALQATLTTLAQAQGPVQALVHAAGIMGAAPLGALDAARAERMWRVHVLAAQQLSNTLVPPMAAAGWGRVVLLGSRVAHGMPQRSEYAATKAALVAQARSWAAEVAPHGVTVNVVAPAATETGMLADPARQASAPRLPPIGRLIRPAEVAALTAFVLSDAAAAITGQELLICGGASLNT